MPLGKPGMAATVEAGAARGSESRILFDATLIGALEPKLPDSLVWYPHEPTWKAIADGRMQFGLHDFNLNVTYEDDFGVNAGLKALAFKSGLDLGGKFEDHEATTWRIAGQFRSDG